MVNITMDITKEKENMKKYLQEQGLEIYKNPKYKGTGSELIYINGCWIRISFLLRSSKDLLEQMKNFVLRKDDIILTGFPRSGSTWMNEIVYLIMNNADTAKAKEELQEIRVPYMEYPIPGLASLAKMPSPRILKSHLPLQLMPEQLLAKKCKIIYVMRNSKDVCVSLYHFMTYFYTTDFQGTFEDFFKDFIEGKVNYGCYFDHISRFWSNKEKLDNILFIKYEDMQRDIHKSIKEMANFLEKELSSEETNTIVDHCKINNMKQNASTNFAHWESRKLVKPSPENDERVGLIRKGISDGWMNYFTSEMVKKMDELAKVKWQSLGLNYSDLTQSWNF